MIHFELFLLLICLSFILVLRFLAIQMRVELQYLQLRHLKVVFKGPNEVLEDIFDLYLQEEVVAQLVGLLA